VFAILVGMMGEEDWGMGERERETTVVVSGKKQEEEEKDLWTTKTEAVGL